MLAEATGVTKIVIACGRTDLRKGIDGLAHVFCKPFLYKIAKCFCRLLHLHFVGDCKASTDSLFCQPQDIADII